MPGRRSALWLPGSHSEMDPGISTAPIREPQDGTEDQQAQPRDAMQSEEVVSPLSLADVLLG